MNLTLNNYKKQTKNVNFSKLSEDIQMVHAKWDAFVKGYGKSDKITEMINNHLKALKPYIPVTSSPKPKPKTTPSKTRPKRTTKTNGNIAKEVKEKPLVKKPNKVIKIPAAVRLVRSYLRLHNKTVTERQVVSLYQRIQKAAAQREIRKSNKYADEITRVVDDLAQTYREMDDKCKFVVPDELHKKLTAISEDYKVSPTTSFIKRFINLYDDISIPRAKRLLSNIKSAKKNKKVTRRNSGYDKLNEIQEILENYIHSDKLQVTAVQLRGLQGFSGLGK